MVSVQHIMSRNIGLMKKFTSLLRTGFAAAAALAAASTAAVLSSSWSDVGDVGE